MYKQKTFGSYTFGCRVNEAEKIAIDNQMIVAGFLNTQDHPDIYIINSCAVTAKAEREARQMILKLKRENPTLKLVVTGCGVTHWRKTDIWNNIPIDLIISNSDKEFTTRLILKRFYKDAAFKKKSPQNSTLQQGDKFLSSGRVMIKIQDGCHRFCSYCIVPYLRGAPKSKKISVILNDLKKYGSKTKEVIYTAINTEDFGKDTNETAMNLINQTLIRTEIKRISFGSIHPWSINDEFIKYYRDLSLNTRFSNFFHVPLQSGSNRILRVMKREYEIEDVIDKLTQIQKINPLSLIATDIIVGFLEETDKEFEETYKLLELSPINKFHVFRFSPRQNTAAYYLKKRLNEPSDKKKIERAKRLTTLGTLKYNKFIQKFVGLTDEALFIGNVKEGYQQTILNNQVSALIKTNVSLRGSMKHVKITGLQNKILMGEVV